MMMHVWLYACVYVCICVWMNLRMYACLMVWLCKCFACSLLPLLLFFFFFFVFSVLFFLSRLWIKGQTELVDLLNVTEKKQTFVSELNARATVLEQKKTRTVFCVLLVFDCRPLCSCVCVHLCLRVCACVNECMSQCVSVRLCVNNTINPLAVTSAACMFFFFTLMRCDCVLLLLFRHLLLLLPLSVCLLS